MHDFYDRLAMLLAVILCVGCALFKRHPEATESESNDDNCTDQAT